MPKTEIHLFTCDFFSNIEGCEMKGKAVLFPSYNLHKEFFKTEIVRFKNEKNSYQSRYTKHSERLKLGEKNACLKTPEVYWHEQMQNLGDSQIHKEHLKGMPKSKNVVRQLPLEFRESFLKDPNVLKGLDILRKELKMKIKSKSVDGFIQFLAY